MLKIRLKRQGRKNEPHYVIGVADSKWPRDGKLLEILGSYHPLLNKDNPSRVSMNIGRVEYWISVGVQLTDCVKRLLQLQKRLQNIDNKPTE